MTDIHAPAGFKSAIPARERPQTHALDRAATGICCENKRLQILSYGYKIVTLL